MANNKDAAQVSAPGTSAEEQLAALQAQLATAQAEAAEAKELAAKAQTENERLREAATTGRLPIEGSYKGYGFIDGHKNIRDREGRLCDTTMLLKAATEGDAQAVDTLDWLIRIEYAYLQKVD